MKCLLEDTKVERIMYSVDYPFETYEKGRDWFQQLETSGLLTGHDCPRERGTPAEGADQPPLMYCIRGGRRK